VGWLKSQGGSAATVLHQESSTRLSARSSGSGFRKSIPICSSLRCVGYTTRLPSCEPSVIVALFPFINQCLYNVCTICVTSQLMGVDKGYMYTNVHYRTYRFYHYSSICGMFTALSSAGSSLSSLSSSESLILDRLTWILATFCKSLAHWSAA